jgi:hypothetical protein
MKRLQVFISSTYTDLKDERQAAVSAILKAGHIPAGMELFAAGDESQMQTIKRWIDESDIFMLILGGRYGSIEPNTSLSYMELEYDYAIETGKPLFAVVIEESALDQKVKSQGRAVIEGDHSKELAAFREKVLSRTSAFFSDVRDIRLAVHETIPDFIDRYDFMGWISGAEVPDLRPFIEQVKKLTEENKRLAADNDNFMRQLQQGGQQTVEETSYDELIGILEGVKLKTSVFQEDGNEKTYNLLGLLRSFGDRFTNGIHNRAGMRKIDQFLYFNVLPKLQRHGLAINEGIPGVVYRRSALSPKGLGLLAYLDKTNPQKARKQSK